jgi:hypothetical protein
LEDVGRDYRRRRGIGRQGGIGRRNVELLGGLDAPELRHQQRVLGGHGFEAVFELANAFT